MPGPFSGTPLAIPNSWLIGSCTHLYQSELGSTGEPGPPPGSRRAPHPSGNSPGMKGSRPQRGRR